MEHLSFGVIGVGEMGKFHAETLQYHVPGARLTAIADVNFARAQAVASDLEVASCYDNAESLLARTDIDAVVISSPPKFHGTAIRLAVAARKQIFCEKPLAITLEEADSALAAVSDAGLNLQVGHMRRYDPAYAEAKRRVAEGEIGRIIVFKSIGRDYNASPAAAAHTDLNGTLFHDSTSHDFDLARWFTGDEVTEVHAYAGSLAIPEMKRFGGFDSGVVNLQFAGGAVGNVESYIDARYGYDVRTEIVGTRGTIQVGYTPPHSDDGVDSQRPHAGSYKPLAGTLFGRLPTRNEGLCRQPSVRSSGSRDGPRRPSGFGHCRSSRAVPKRASACPGSTCSRSPHLSESRVTTRVTARFSFSKQNSEFRWSDGTGLPPPVS